MSYIGFPSNPPPQFPTLSVVGFPVHKKPFFTAWEHKSVNGTQYQTARQAYPNWDFVLQYAEDGWLREQTQNIQPYSPNAPHVEFEAISQLFLSCFGSYGEFLYNDPTDNTRSGQFIGLGTGSQTIFRIIRTWGTGQLARTEPIGAIDLFYPTNIYLNGTLQSATSYTVTNPLTGSILTFSSAPALNSIITMDFKYFFRCHFKEDLQQYDQWAYNLWQLGKCEFRSVKP